MSAITTAPTDALLTAEEYLRSAPPDCPSELVRGRIVKMNPPFTAHGYWCKRVVRFLDDFVEQHDLGWVVCNDAGVITERDPDTVRGADVAYFSYQRIPKGILPEGYWPAAPDLVIEIRSSDDRWPQIQRKVSEYREAGVTTVCVVDPVPRTVHVFTGDSPGIVLRDSDVLTLPEVLPGFELPVARLFRL